MDRLLTVVEKIHVEAIFNLKKLFSCVYKDPGDKGEKSKEDEQMVRVSLVKRF